MLRARCQTSKSFIRLCKNVNFQCGRYIANYATRQGKRKTLYDELGVDIDATDRDIKKAYLELCKKYHPDSDVKDKSLHAKFVKINEAFSVLSKPSERRLYDQALQAGLNPEPGEVNTMENWNPNHAQYYYHPRFYHDPKMREAAAKAWEADSGMSFYEYYEEKNKSDKHKATPEDKRLGVLLSTLLMIIGALLAVRVYLRAMTVVAENRREAAAYNRRHEELEKSGKVVVMNKMPDDHPLKAHKDPLPDEEDFEFLYHKKE